MQEGDVVLTPIPQADGRVKNRPALILREMPSHGDFLVCGISTQLHRSVPGFDEIISPTDADFASSGLVAASLIRLSFLAVLPRKDIAGTIGSIAPKRQGRLLEALSNHLV
ncbi:MAG: type II toxin-antitoxin system PemK/MazF family toxin, partial [Terriglobia bacterium]